MTAKDSFLSAVHIKFAELARAVETKVRYLFLPSKATFLRETATRFSVIRVEDRSTSLSVELEDDLQSIRIKIDETTFYFGISITDEGEICLFNGKDKISEVQAVCELLSSFLLKGFFDSQRFKTRKHH